jgi:pilus assembly protein Flp/PilA
VLLKTWITTLMDSIEAPGVARVWPRFLEDEGGQDLVEYALVAVFIALGLVATLKTLSSNLATFFGTLGTTLTSSV